MARKFWCDEHNHILDGCPYCEINELKLTIIGTNHIAKVTLYELDMLRNKFLDLPEESNIRRHIADLRRMVNEIISDQV